MKTIIALLLSASSIIGLPAIADANGYDHYEPTCEEIKSYPRLGVSYVGTVTGTGAHVIRVGVPKFPQNRVSLTVKAKYLKAAFRTPAGDSNPSTIYACPIGAKPYEPAGNFGDYNLLPDWN